MAVGYTHALSSLLGTFRYGLTRQSFGIDGVNSGPFANPSYQFDTVIGLGGSSAKVLPVHTISEDLSWSRGTHSLQFGAVARVIRNRSTTQSVFPQALGEAWRLSDGGQSLRQSAPDVDPNFAISHADNLSAVLGLLNVYEGTYYFDIAGKPFPLGSHVSRDFGLQEYEMYIQDTWRPTHNLTLTGGVRWSLTPSVREVNGQQATMAPSYDVLFAQRVGLAEAGLPSHFADRISFVGGANPRPLYPFHKGNFAPRLAAAYHRGRTVIRAGAGLLYEAFGMGMMEALNRDTFGLSSLVRTTQGRYDVATSPRFTGIDSIPQDLILPVPAGGPGTPPDGFDRSSSAIDYNLRTPFTMNVNVAVSRELPGGFTTEVSYVGRFSRRSLVRDQGGSQPLNFRESVSGVRLFDALTQMDQFARAGTPVSEVSPNPFWENLYHGAGGNGLTATQSVYNVLQNYPTDMVGSGLLALDVTCDPFCSDYGPYTFFNPQYWGLFALRSGGSASYNSFQWNIRKRFAQGIQFDMNYTLSRSTDLYSLPETYRSGDRWSYKGAATILNAQDYNAQRAVSDFDMTHQWNANWIIELPFGSGKPWLRHASGAVNQLVGGWQISGLARVTSGLPYSAINGYHFSTTWCCETYAQTIGVIPSQTNRRNSTIGGPNLFDDPRTARNAFDFVYPGQIGQRHTLRGEGMFTVDVGLSKRFTLPWERSSIQIRAEVFNLTNSTRFGFYSDSSGDTHDNNLFIDSPSFGRYTRTINSPRVFQFGLRFEF